MDKHQSSVTKMDKWKFSDQIWISIKVQWHVRRLTLLCIGKNDEFDINFIVNNNILEST
jgi:hypothetical protein